MDVIDELLSELSYPKFVKSWLEMLTGNKSDVVLERGCDYAEE